ncbi:MAG: hypothetical protein R3A79_10045 [Nannocystaceae bacterium]
MPTTLQTPRMACFFDGAAIAASWRRLQERRPPALDLPFLADKIAGWLGGTATQITYRPPALRSPIARRRAAAYERALAERGVRIDPSETDIGSTIFLQRLAGGFDRAIVLTSSVHGLIERSPLLTELCSRPRRQRPRRLVIHVVTPPGAELIPHGDTWPVLDSGELDAGIFRRAVLTARPRRITNPAA